VKMRGRNDFKELRDILVAMGPCDGSIGYLDQYMTGKTINEAFEDISNVIKHEAMPPGWANWTIRMCVQHNVELEKRWREDLFEHIALEHPRRVARTYEIIKHVLDEDEKAAYEELLEGWEFPELED